MNEPTKKPPEAGSRFLKILNVVSSLASIAGFILALVMLFRS